MNQSGLKFLLVFILLLSSATSIAQFSAPTPTPKVVVYAGYSGYNPGGKSSGVEIGRLPHGWNTAAELQFTPRYSFIADFGGYSRSTVGSAHTYLFGPKFTFHRGPFAPFAQVMMGFQRLAPKATPSYTAFSEAVGGGLDVAIARRWSVRLFQADFIYAADHEKGSLPLNQFFGARVSAGLVWNFGSPHRSREGSGKKPAPAAEPAVAAKSEPAPPAPEAPKTESTPAESEASATSNAAASSEPAASAEAPKTEAAAATTEPAAPAATDPASQPATEAAAQPEPTKPVEPVKQAEPAKQEQPEAPETAEAKKPAASVSADAKPAAAAPESQKTEPAPAEKPAEASPAVEAHTAQEAKSAQPVATAASAQNVVEEKRSEENEKSEEVQTSAARNPVEPPLIAKAAAPASPDVAASVPTSAPKPAVKQIAIVQFPYDQYLTLLSAQDKRSLNAVASRLKLEPESKIVIVGNALRWEGPKTAGQRAVNAKDQLVQKGIAADRIQVYARPLPASRRKYPPAKTEVLIVPAGATYDAAAVTPVDEQQVKPEHLHVAHPDWREK